MYSIGDTIVHNRHGAGTVVGEKKVTLNGVERHYICIELADKRSTLMVQPDELDPAEIRMTMDDFSVLREVFNDQPEILSDQHRSRQHTLQSKLNSNNPQKVAQVLRDLIWRERTASLTETDKRIKDKAERKLIRELNLSDEINSAGNRLNEIIERTMQKHMDSLGAQVQV